MKIIGRVLTTCFAAAITIFSVSFLYAFKFDFITVSDVVGNIRKSFGAIDSYQANFTILSEKLGKTTRQTGIIKYKANNRLHIEFTQPQGQKIVSNGKMMWIYIPSMNVVAEQDLDTGSGIFASGSRSGLNWLFSKYHYRFATKEQPETQSNGSKMYTLILKQKESRSGYRNMKLWVNERYFIVRAQGETSTGKKIEIQFTGLKINIDIPNSLFRFDIPARARVVKNPMITEE
ncbi:MAG: outer membrane lipoprotein carrier protein LolA [Spirochaetes bacterium]|nr:outer membrane lipoprotein carrier protein LolA [Spirochaetota bacterium]